MLTLRNTLALSWSGAVLGVPSYNLWWDGRETRKKNRVIRCSLFDCSSSHNDMRVTLHEYFFLRYPLSGMNMGLFSMLRYDPFPIKGKGSEHYLE